MSAERTRRYRRLGSTFAWSPRTDAKVVFHCPLDETGKLPKTWNNAADMTCHHDVMLNFGVTGSFFGSPAHSDRLYAQSRRRKPQEEGRNRQLCSPRVRVLPLKYSFIACRSRPETFKIGRRLALSPIAPFLCGTFSVY